jgi:hypothetical protein
MRINTFKLPFFDSRVFVDDLSTLFWSKSIEETKKELQKYLDSMEKWLNKWRLCMSPSKCNYIILHNGSRSVQGIKLLLYNEQIPRTQSTKILVVTSDEKLNFKKHIEEIYNKCLKRINILKILKQKAWCLENDT